MELFKIIFYLGALKTVFINSLSDHSNNQVNYYEQVLRKLTDEVSREEVEKRDRMRLLEYLQQAIKDKQIELRLENDELKSRYLELNRTHDEPSIQDMNLYEDSSLEEEDLTNRIKELESKMVVLRAYGTSRPSRIFGERKYPYAMSQHNQVRYNTGLVYVTPKTKSTAVSILPTSAETDRRVPIQLPLRIKL